MTEVRHAIDRQHLETLRTRFGATFVVQMIDLFIAQGKERIDAAEEALGQGDATAIGAAAHALKSSAGNLGATALAALASETERLARGGSAASDLAPNVKQLARAFAEAEEQLEKIRTAIAS